MAPTAKATATPKLELEFKFERDTKNAMRYQQVSDEDRPEVGTLYITKKGIANAGLPGKHLRVTIEEMTD